MNLSRRAMIKSGALLVSVGATAKVGFTESQATVFIFDSRVPASRHVVTSAKDRRIDVALEDRNFWRNIRDLHVSGTVEGLISWSDWVIVRGLLEEQGKRLKSEQAEGSLFRWTMG